MHRVATLAILVVMAACQGAHQEAEDGNDAQSMLAGSDGSHDGGPMPPACSPDEATYASEIAPIAEQFCSQCHGDPVTAGAPYVLNSYEAFMGTHEGTSIIAAVVGSLASGNMPPAGQPRLRAIDRNALLDWATCGEAPEFVGGTPNMGGDFDVDRSVLGDPGTAPDNTDFFELRADEFTVDEDMRDRYECFTFEAPIGEDRFMRRIETVIDDARVLHHVVLLPDSEADPGTHQRCGDENPLSLIYGWAPGQGALQFDNGGIRIRPGQKLMLQIHYNNSAGFQNVRDSSGVRIYHGPPEGEEIAMLTLGPLGFELPPRRTSLATGWCQLPNDTRVIASFPHMHELGIGITTQVSRSGAAEESMVTLSGWDFDAQYIYETPMELAAGDVIRTTCRYRNPNEELVRFGGGTGDEMCFNFTYVTPPPEVTFCNQNQPPLGGDYVPGPCAPPGAQTAPTRRISSGIIEGEPAELEGGEIPEGLWSIIDAQIYIPSSDLGQFELDYLLSSVAGFGVFQFVDQRLYLDMSAQIHLVADGIAFDTVQEFSFAGAYSHITDEPSALGLEVSCGELPNEDSHLYFQSDENGMQLIVPVQLGPIAVKILVIGQLVESP